MRISAAILVTNMLHGVKTVSRPGRNILFVLGMVILAPFAAAAADPEIAAQPVCLTNLQGSPATFSVNATGTHPLSFQWYFNGPNPLANATNGVLIIPGVQLTSEGNYSVVIRNSAGSITSQPAFLKVLPSPRRPGAPGGLRVVNVK